MPIPDADTPYCIVNELLLENPMRTASWVQVTKLAEQYGLKEMLRECQLHLQLELDYQRKQV